MTTRREREQKEMRYNDAKERAEKHEKAFEPTSLNLPKDVKMFKFKRKGLYRLDILPYRVGKGNPFCDEGRYHYERTYYTYRLPTIVGDRIYCDPARTFNKQSPFPAFIAKMVRSGAITQDQADEMGPKERQLFNVIDLDAKDQGVQLFEFNHWQLGRLIDSKVEKKEKYKTFFHLKGGYTLEIDVDEGTFKGKTIYTPINISFEPRDDYDPDILDHVYCLDDIPKQVPYEELELVLTEGGEQPSEEKSVAKSSANGRKKDEDEDEDEDEETAGLDEEEEDDDEEKLKELAAIANKNHRAIVAAESKKGSRSSDDDEDEDEDDEDEEFDLDEDDDEDEEPAPRKKTAKKQ